MEHALMRYGVIAPPLFVWPAVLAVASVLLLLLARPAVETSALLNLGIAVFGAGYLARLIVALAAVVAVGGLGSDSRRGGSAAGRREVDQA